MTLDKNETKKAPAVFGQENFSIQSGNITYRVNIPLSWLTHSVGRAHKGRSVRRERTFSFQANEADTHTHIGEIHLIVKCDVFKYPAVTEGYISSACLRISAHFWTRTSALESKYDE